MNVRAERHDYIRFLELEFTMFSRRHLMTAFVGWAMMFLLLTTATAQQDVADITRLAPEKCDLCLVWTGDIKPDPNGADFERWLAQPEILDGIQSIREWILAMAGGEDGERQQATELVLLAQQMAMQQPWILFTEEIDFENPQTQFAVELGELAEEFETRFAAFEAESELQTESFNIGTNEFKRGFPRNGSAIEYGIYRGHFLFSVGDGGLERLLANFDTNTPKWIAELQAKLPIERIAGMFHLDFANLHKMSQGNGNVPAELHLEEFERITATLGLEDGESVSRILLHCPENLQGILKSFESTPLTLEEIAAAPDGVNTLFAAKFRPQMLWEILTTNEDSKDEISEFVASAKSNFGIDFENDVINSFDELMYSYQQLSLVNPAASGVAVFRVKNPEEFSARLDEIVDSINESSDMVDIEFEDKKSGTVYKINPYAAPPQFSVAGASFQLIGNELVFAADPKAISSHVRKKKRTKGKLNQDDRLKEFFDNSKNGGLGQPIAVQYLDINSVISVVYSVLPMLAQGPLAAAEFDFEQLPDLDVVTNGVKPDIIGIYRTENGFQILERTTLPGLTTATPVAIGMLLPAVQQVRQAARRSQSQNNVRQLILSSHNYESARQALPPAYTRDENGKKLLSWRVHILPYLKENELYEKFHLDEPWDSPHNKALISEMPPSFEHPGLDLEPGHTVYLGVAGEDAAFSSPGEPENGEQDRTGTKISDISDGTANTIMIVEANGEHAVPWTAPQDFGMDQEDLVSPLVGNWSGDGIIIGHCDGSVRMLTSPTHELLKKMFTISGGEVIGD